MMGNQPFYQHPNTLGKASLALGISSLVLVFGIGLCALVGTAQGWVGLFATPAVWRQPLAGDRYRRTGLGQRRSMSIHRHFARTEWRRVSTTSRLIYQLSIYFILSYAVIRV